jgi:hypothetical protein
VGAYGVGNFLKERTTMIFFVTVYYTEFLGRNLEIINLDHHLLKFLLSLPVLSTRLEG